MSLIYAPFFCRRPIHVDLIIPLAWIPGSDRMGSDGELFVGNSISCSDSEAAMIYGRVFDCVLWLSTNKGGGGGRGEKAVSHDGPRARPGHWRWWRMHDGDLKRKNEKRRESQFRFESSASASACVSCEQYSGLLFALPFPFGDTRCACTFLVCLFDCVLGMPVGDVSFDITSNNIGCDTTKDEKKGTREWKNRKNARAITELWGILPFFCLFSQMNVTQSERALP